MHAPYHFLTSLGIPNETCNSPLLEALSATDCRQKCSGGARSESEANAVQRRGGAGPVPPTACQMVRYPREKSTSLLRLLVPMMPAPMRRPVFGSPTGKDCVPSSEAASV